MPQAAHHCQESVNESSCSGACDRCSDGPDTVHGSSVSLKPRPETAAPSIDMLIAEGLEVNTLRRKAGSLEANCRARRISRLRRRYLSATRSRSYSSIYVNRAKLTVLFTAAFGGAKTQNLPEPPWSGVRNCIAYRRWGNF